MVRVYLVSYYILLRVRYGLHRRCIVKNKFIEIPANKNSIARRRPVYGIGVNDADYIISAELDGKRVICPYYTRWTAMIERCYSEKFQSKKPSYIGCAVCDEWLTFSNFKAWMIKQDWQNKELDKDIKITGNKVYSPETCLLVSQEINKLLNDNAAARGAYPQGVCYHKNSGKFHAKCTVESKINHLGYFDRPESASEAYIAFKSKLILSIAERQEQPLKGYLTRIAGEFQHKIRIDIMFVLEDSAETKQREKPVYLKGMSGIGPMYTESLDEAEKFHSKTHAMQSPAYVHWACFFEPKEII